MSGICDTGFRQAVGKQPHAKVVLPSCINLPSSRRLASQRNQNMIAAAQSSGLSSSVQLGPSDERASTSSQNRATSLEEIQLESQAGEDYTVLLNHLQAKEFQKADDETRALLIRLAGPDAVKRGWVYFTEVKFIPESDLQTIDSLWSAASSGKFGYSVQKELWLKMSQRWDRFFQEIDWVQGENNNYRKWPKEFIYSTDAARGHLPLTNCLRGTQLFKAILEHPAFIKADRSGNGSGNPSWLD